jgi:thiamine pyrophosphokinase
MLPLLQAADLLIAADGGAKRLYAAGIRPQVLIGDLDSVDTETLNWLHESSDSCCEIMRLPSQKDETDLELALLLARERLSATIDILGATGGRLDHTLANIALLSMDELMGCRVRLLDSDQEIVLIRANEPYTLVGQPGDTVSLLPFSGVASGITIQGFYYPLQNATLHASRARGISNILLHQQGTITLTQGFLICIHHFDRGAYQLHGYTTHPHQTHASTIAHIRALEGDTQTRYRPTSTNTNQHIAASGNE